MKTQHTKGEWKIDKTLFKNASDSSIAIVCNGNWTAEAKGAHVSKISPDEIEANAKLIAAAPELLEALEYILDAIESGKMYIEEIEMSDDLSPEEWQLKAIETVQKATE